ncbi:UDP-glucose--hexose-1-phosphate uridylyltransferase [Salirhabdus sp. Marseille-P4669]|uniref:UDP-glucose--hexose-1-phosphate uridylyltransferase n=1 Tax=Salirhabdus sp. Marseille-P4669 TaxID=2042310 RepID=UPI000C7E1622|nr:UDP-glucose--hexose-1-phosphate uridylyltransferase [Salirhabdus sp. Marseille-P4669]
MSIPIYQEIGRLLQYGLQKGLIEKWDVDYVRNQLLDTLGLKDWQESEIPEEQLDNPSSILENMLDWAAEQNLFTPNTVTNRDLFDARIMGHFVPHPSTVNNHFKKLAREKGIEQATDYFYQFSQDVHYIRTNRVQKNMHWLSATPYGDMEITINLSKPEKDPRDIAAAKKDRTNYPECVLCKNNVGYAGRTNHPARQNHRIIPLELNGDQWYLQYSPYVYYNQHAIVLSEAHRPMKINKKAFENLLAFVEQFPHFFIGSNADLPIVGGSILNHDHYQAGQHDFPMAKASIKEYVTLTEYPAVKVGILDWPMSVIRLQSDSKEDLTNLAAHILQAWQQYEDPTVEILKETNGVPHNTITPIARRRNDLFELDLVLRNNRTNEEHPMGIFHPHAEVHHIKKENIGLIEVMGLAVLPGRLKDELEKLVTYLALPDYKARIEQDPETSKHVQWAVELMEKYDKVEITKAILQKELADKFRIVLEHAAVFKKDAKGKDAFCRFYQSLND